MLTCPLVCNVFASGVRSWCASATDQGVYCGSASARARRGDRGVPSATDHVVIVEGAAGAVPAVVDVPVIMQRRGVRRHPCRGADAGSLGLP